MSAGLREQLAEQFPDCQLTLADGLDAFVVGVGHWRGDCFLVYDRDGVVEKLMADGLSQDEAEVGDIRNPAYLIPIKKPGRRKYYLQDAGTGEKMPARYSRITMAWWARDMMRRNGDGRTMLVRHEHTEEEAQ